MTASAVPDLDTLEPGVHVQLLNGECWTFDVDNPERDIFEPLRKGRYSALVFNNRNGDAIAVPLGSIAWIASKQRM